MRALVSMGSLYLLRFLYLTRCVLVGSEGGDGPALLTATMRNWYSAFSLR